MTSKKLFVVLLLVATAAFGQGTTDITCCNCNEYGEEKNFVLIHHEKYSDCLSYVWTDTAASYSDNDVTLLDDDTTGFVGTPGVITGGAIWADTSTDTSTNFALDCPTKTRLAYRFFGSKERALNYLNQEQIEQVSVVALLRWKPIDVGMVEEVTTKEKVVTETIRKVVWK
jgi:hypothetical protein